MRLQVRFQEEQDLNIRFLPDSTTFAPDFGEIQTIHDMNYNIIDVINSLADKSDDFFSKGEVDSSKIAQSEESLGVNFSKDFWKYTQKFGYIEVDGMELCGVVDSRHVSTVIRTQNMRELFSDFPMDCYVIESVGIDNAVMVQKPDGKIYQFLSKILYLCTSFRTKTQ